MPNYLESNIVGSRYLRVRRIAGENAIGATPGLTFIEEQVIVLENETITKPTGLLQADLSTPTQQFDLLNPETDEVIGTAQYQDVFAILYSLYRHLATQRDNA